MGTVPNAICMIKCISSCKAQLNYFSFIFCWCHFALKLTVVWKSIEQIRWNLENEVFSIKRALCMLNVVGSLGEKDDFNFVRGLALMHVGVKPLKIRTFLRIEGTFNRMGGICHFSNRKINSYKKEPTPTD